MRAIFALALPVVAAGLLGGCGGDDAASDARFAGRDVAAWTALLGSEDMEVRERTIHQLVAGGASAVPVLREVIAVRLGDEQRTVMRLRAGEMAEITLALVGAAAVPALVDALGDDNEWARIHAAGAVERMHPAPAETAEPLTANLTHADSTVRATSARALGELGAAAASAAPALATALGDEDPHVREAAATSLGGIGPPAADAAHDALVATLADRAEDVRAAAVQALEAVGPRPGALPALLGLLPGDDLAALYVPSAIGALGADAAPAVPPLTAALGHADWDRRSSVAVALGRVGAPAAAAADALLGLLDDPVLMVREAAAEALGRIGVAREDVRSGLRRLAAEDDEERVRTAAREALERLGG